jgi:putative ABC transport system ATP-binding protein
MIRLEGAAKAWPGPVWALHPTDLEIGDHEMVVVLGPSGSGKTTLLNLIGGLDVPSEGRVFVGDACVSELPRDALIAYRQRGVGIVFQFHNLIPNLTARENVELAAGLVGREGAVDEALASVGLAERGARFPHELSGGEQQRVAIARALVKDPPLILADEPTGNLDGESGKVIVGLLRDLHRAGRCVVLVTHNAVIAQVASRVIRMRDGRIREDRPNDRPMAVEALEW